MTALPSSPAAGVAYFESDLMPGRPMFRCDRLSASLQVTRCASMWAEANASANPPDRSDRCRACHVGAQHAGATDPNYHRLRASGACSRCHRSDLRLIGGNLCVGCKNREYEWVKGKNAKGKFPACHPTLAPRAVQFRAGGKVGKLARSLTASTMELVVELLRDSPDRVVLGLGRGRPYGAG